MDHLEEQDRRGEGEGEGAAVETAADDLELKQMGDLMNLFNLPAELDAFLTDPLDPTHDPTHAPIPLDWPNASFDLHAPPYVGLHSGTQQDIYLQRGPEEFGRGFDRQSEANLRRTLQPDDLPPVRNAVSVPTRYGALSHTTSKTSRTEDMSTIDDRLTSYSGEHAIPALAATTTNTSYTTTSESAIQLSCDYPGCGKSFARPSDLTKHKRNHTPKKERQFICSICQSRWLFRKDLRRHQLTHSIASFVCAECNSAFKRKDHLERHNQSRHATPSSEGPNHIPSQTTQEGQPGPSRSRATTIEVPGNEEVRHATPSTFNHDLIHSPEPSATAAFLLDPLLEQAHHTQAHDTTYGTLPMYTRSPQGRAYNPFQSDIPPTLWLNDVPLTYDCRDYLSNTN